MFIVYYFKYMFENILLFTLLGPPGPPAGVTGADVTADTILLRWSKGTDHGKPITSYVVEGFNEDEGIWRTYASSKLSFNTGVLKHHCPILTNDLFHSSVMFYQVLLSNAYYLVKPYFSN